MKEGRDERSGERMIEMKGKMRELRQIEAMEKKGKRDTGEKENEFKRRRRRERSRREEKQKEDDGEEKEELK